MRVKALFLQIFLVVSTVALLSAQPSTEPQRHVGMAVRSSVSSSPSAPGEGGHLAQVSEQRVLVRYAQLPLHFEANQGQTDARVRFLSRGSGFTLFLTADEALLSLNPPTPAADLAQGVTERSEIDAQTVGNSAPFARRDVLRGDAAAAQPEGVLRIKLLGSNIEPAVEGADE